MEERISTALIKCLVKNGEKSIAQKELEEILDRDIHDTSLGCKIPNTHIRIGKVHLDTFYEAQLLFGNAYWTDIFAFYFYKFIMTKVQENNGFKKKQPIILYGYETYSTLTLNKTISFLESEGFNLHLRIFEVKDNRVRYCDEDVENGDQFDSSLLCDNPVVFFFMGISSTLSTFKHMNDALCLINDKYSIVSKYCTSIIQVIGTGKDDDTSNKILSIQQDKLGPYVKCASHENYLSFIKDENLQKAYFYVSVKSTWYIPQACKLCMPASNYLEEYPLIEVNEASVVPTQMIRLNKIEYSQDIEDPVEIFANTTTECFLNDFANKKYLHYGHIERNNNHFQYYFRLSRLYHDKKNDIEDWLKKLKNNYNFVMDRTVNIIVAPQHYSNTGFINSVNNIIFNGTAHIMEFDIHKEYRSNFKAKYNNYSELEKIVNDLKDYTVNFYYVNDQIVSGAAYYRTKSLVKSLFTGTNNKFHIFNGIFVLLNRNSFDTRRNYTNVSTCKREGLEKNYLPYFSYLNLVIPSLRSYDDSCPICFNRNKFLEIINECALDSSVLHWQKKIISYRKKSVSEVRREKNNSLTSQNYFIKLQCENDLWISIYNAYREISDRILLIEEQKTVIKREIIIKSFFDCISSRISKFDDATKIEYLITYIKIMSRALLYYQEDVKKACFYILLKIFDYFCSNKDLSTNNIELSFSKSFPIGDNYINLDINKKELRELKYDLYRVTISRLCSIGSCALLEINRLKKCRELGRYMHNELNDLQESFDTFLLHSIKKLLCYDKGDSKAIMLQELLYNQLEKHINDEEFFLKLYLENLRNPLIVKNSNTIKELKQLNQDDITEKYKKLVTILKRECSNVSTESVEIQIFTSLDSKNNNFIDITEGQIPLPLVAQDFVYDESHGIFYISIGNNFEQLKSFLNHNNFEKILESELKIIKSAIIILGVKTKNIEHIAQMLKYRKEIMEMVQADFNNDAIPKLIMARGQTKILSEIKTVTHKNTPLQEFEKIFVDMQKENVTLELQRNFLSLYMDTVISIAYREHLRFNEYKFSTLKEENSMFSLSYNFVGDCLEYAEKQIKEMYGDDIKLELGKMIDKEFKQYTDKRQKELRQDFKKKAAILRFRDSKEICECYMVIRTLIENAHKHCANPKIWIRLVEDINGGNFDLYVENTINTSIHSPSDKGITLCALKYIFNRGKESDVNCFVCNPSEIAEENKYKIIIRNFIINISEE